VYGVEIASCCLINVRSFMKIDTNVQTILKFGFINLRGCNTGITDGRNLLITPLRWGQVSRYT
jgi:hypothetical protein